MSAFSFTAPYITEDEEKLERQNLSASERMELERDLFGPPSSNVTTTTTTAAAAVEAETAAPTVDLIELSRRVREAITTLPMSVKQDYVTAQERVPQLVETESDPAAFLRCCDYQVERAAQRCVAYWEVRMQLFGPERGLLPMTQAGAMAEDCVALEKALVQVLSVEDAHGRPILFWDRIRCVKQVINRDQVARVHFYLLHVLTQRESVQTNGYVWMIFLKGFDLYMHFDRILDKKLFRVLNAVPALYRSVHTFTGSGQSVVGLTMPVLKHMGGRYYRLRLVLHAGSDKEILERLALYGITGDHLGAYVGGRYNNTREPGEFRQWLDTLRHNEVASTSTTTTMTTTSNENEQE